MPVEVWISSFLPVQLTPSQNALLFQKHLPGTSSQSPANASLKVHDSLPGPPVHMRVLRPICPDHPRYCSLYQIAFRQKRKKKRKLTDLSCCVSFIFLASVCGQLLVQRRSMMTRDISSCSSFDAEKLPLPQGSSWSLQSGVHSGEEQILGDVRSWPVPVACQPLP